VAKIGEGGMGVVYKAIHPTLGIPVAVKTISPNYLAAPEVRTRLKQEARAAAGLSHENIISVYDYDEWEGCPFIVLEFLQGEDLKAIITARKPMGIGEKFRIMISLCAGLSHAHGLGIIHRDIKPGNIFITQTGRVKILDFGLARPGSSDLTRTGMKMGTPAYMSPEQIQGKRPDYRTDIFSAGVVFYELLTYSKAFTGDSDYAISFKIVQQDPEPIEQIDPTIPGECSQILSRALAKDPALRYQSTAEFGRDLEGALKAIQEREQEVHRLYMEVRRLDETVEPARVLELLDRILTLAPRHVAALVMKQEIVDARARPTESSMNAGRA
jgi:serine/threonine-protein kinase